GLPVLHTITPLSLAQSGHGSMTYKAHWQLLLLVRRGGLTA
ncbi:MAG: hypothetical protein H6Q05_5116, partial [Acidobacteria bacterium]|nr:hypothetical protein [Acidobacteriota bacterium]